MPNKKIIVKVKIVKILMFNKFFIYINLHLLISNAKSNSLKSENAEHDQKHDDP